MCRVKDNIGLAYKFTKKYESCSASYIQDTETFSDALAGLSKADRDYDENRISARTGKKVQFSTVAFQYMRNECLSGYNKRKKLSIPEVPLKNANELVAKVDFCEVNLCQRMVEIIQSLNFDNKDKVNLDTLYLYYLDGYNMQEIACLYNVTKQAIFQRLNRMLEKIASMVDYDELREQALETIEN